MRHWLRPMLQTFVMHSDSSPCAHGSNFVLFGLLQCWRFSVTTWLTVVLKTKKHIAVTMKGSPAKHICECATQTCRQIIKKQLPLGNQGWEANFVVSKPRFLVFLAGGKQSQRDARIKPRHSYACVFCCGALFKAWLDTERKPTILGGHTPI